MTQKTYRKYKYNTSIAMTIKGIKRAINFKSIGKNMYDFVTTEKDVQDALEKSFEFKKTFYLVDTKELQSEEVKAPIVVNDIVDEDKELIIDPIVDIPIDIDNNDKDLPISNLEEVAGTPTEVPIKPKELQSEEVKAPIVVNDVADEDKELIIDPIVDIPIDIDNNDKDLPISDLEEVAGTHTEVPIKPKEAKPKQPKKPVYKKPKTKK